MADLTLAEMRIIQKIYADNNWQIQKKRINHPKHEDLIDIISEFIAKIDSENRPVVFELLKKYEIINDYLGPSRSLIHQFIKLTNATKRYHFAPIMINEDISKSGVSFVYDLKSSLPSGYKNIEFYNSPFSKKILIDENNIIVFADDFIGTGEQFKRNYDKFIEQKGVPSKFIVLVIRIQRKAFDLINELGGEVIADGIRDCAISSRSAIGDLLEDDARASYLRIENSLQVTPRYSLGYGKAEAIITMKRTPNSTLPIFWVESDNEGERWPAPFPRN